MILSIVYILLASITFTSAHVFKRVVGGVKSPNVYPWMAFLINNDGACGGTLIAKNVIMTAAHCSNNPTDLSNKIVQLYRYDLDMSIMEENPIIFAVEKVIVHPKFTLDKNGVNNGKAK